MKTIFKVLCALFLINSAYLNAAQYDPWQSTTWTSSWHRYLQGADQQTTGQDDQYEDATALSETNDDDYNDILPTDQNTVEIEEKEPICYLCAGECTQDEPYYARLRDYTCRHQFLHKTCSSDTPCDDENCCAHAMMKQWHIQGDQGHIQGDQVLCPFKCAASKTNNYRDLLQKLKKPSYLEKQRELAQIAKKEQEKTVTSQPTKPSMNINNNPILNDQEEQELAEINRQIEEQEMAELNAKIAEFESNEQRQKEFAQIAKKEQEKEADRERLRLEKLRVFTSQYDEENDDATEIYRRIKKLEEIKQKQKAADIKKQEELARIAKEEQEKVASTSRKVGPPIAPKPTHNTTSRVNMSMPIATPSITVPSRFIHVQEEDDVEELLPTASSSNQNQNQDQSLNLGIFASYFDPSNKNDYFINNNDLNNMLLLSFGSDDAIMTAIRNITNGNKDFFANVLIRSLISLTSCYKTNPNPATAQLITTLISHPHTQNIQKQDCPAGSVSKLAAQAPPQLNQTELHDTIKNFTNARK